ncbi:MAG TPA: DUF488 family protein [Nakamurella sp.]|nr:DUF488 family protein [Nakamurella sp.]
MPAMVDNPTVRVRRVYDEPHPDDGTRVLVDRLWPRGKSKTVARLDQCIRQWPHQRSCESGTTTNRTVRRIHPPLPRRAHSTRAGRRPGPSPWWPKTAR